MQHRNARRRSASSLELGAEVPHLDLEPPRLDPEAPHLGREERQSRHGSEGRVLARRAARSVTAPTWPRGDGRAALRYDAASMPLAPGTQIGPYRIASLIGQGGMGEVYRAHDERLSRDVAVKLMSESAPGDPTRMRRMQQEARAAGQLSHPNILGVFDVGTHDDRMYVVTELLEGESLRDVVRRGPVPWRRALALAVPIADGLAAAHDRGIVHRDIKPDNVFLTRDDRIKILDFGVATWRAPSGLDSATAATLSQAGLVVGTVGYMSPEQARGQTVDNRTDVFAFGCVLYELLSGKEAFTGGTPMEILVAIQRDAPAPLQDRVPGLPADLVRIVDRCLEKDPARRFQSTRDLLFALGLVNTNSSPDAPAAVVSTKSADPAPAPPPPAAAPPAPVGARFGRRDALRLGLAGALGGAAVWAGVRAIARPPEVPLFRPITYRRGTVYTARFTTDGTSIVYSAAWDGGSRELFATVPGTSDVRSLGAKDTDAAHVLTTGEIEVIHRSRAGFPPGTLSRMSLAGGPSKPLLEGVLWADGSPDGATLVVVRRAEGRAQLELPPGNRIADGPTISYPRLSPDGKRVAYLEYSGLSDDTGCLVIVDRAGKRLYTSPTWKSIEGLGWRSDDEVWFTASKEGRSLWLHAVTTRGEMRVICRAPGRLVLHDVAADGRVVAERNTYRSTLMAGAAGSPRERDLSWQDFSQLGQIARDGKQVLFSEEGDGAGTGIFAYLRPTDGGAPVRLGEGISLALSPDATQALLRADDKGAHLEIVPVGAGHARRLPGGPFAHITWAAFVPGAPRVVMCAKQGDGPPRLYVQDLGGGAPRPLPAEDVLVNDDGISPDGTLVAGVQGGKVVLVPLDGGPVRPLPGLDPGDRPVAFTGDGRALFVRKDRALSVSIQRYDLAAGQLSPWRTLEPPDPAGVLGIGRVSLARDGEAWVYEIYRLLSDLFVIENLR
jgi:serine/threonine protein kinase